MAARVIESARLIERCDGGALRPEPGVPRACAPVTSKGRHQLPQLNPHDEQLVLAEARLPALTIPSDSPILTHQGL